MQEFSKRTASSLCQLYKALFEVKKRQRAEFGPDGEILEYTKSYYSVNMPDPRIVLPREKPAPKEQLKSKWEKFREERGMPALHARQAIPHGHSRARFAQHVIEREQPKGLAYLC